MIKIKNQRGVVTLIVLVTMLFFTTFLTSTYLILSNKAKTQADISKQTKLLYESENATEVYNSFFAEGNVIPIYTTEQLLKIGSTEDIKINEVGGKIYNFSSRASYILMNNLEFDVDNWTNTLGENTDWTPIGETNYKFDGNGHTIKVTTLSNKQVEYNEENKYIGVKYYIQDGLALHLDGIQNTKAGHNLTTTTWEDLSNNENNAELTNFEMDVTSGWTDNSLLLDGTDDYGTIYNLNVSEPCTLEIVLKTNNTTENQVVFADYNSNIAMGFYDSNTIIGKCGDASKANKVLDIIPAEWSNNIKTCTITYNNGLMYYIEGEEKISSINSNYFMNNSNTYIGARNNGSISFNFKGEIYSIRIYNKVLSDEEIANNYQVDKARFDI